MTKLILKFLLFLGLSVATVYSQSSNTVIPNTKSLCDQITEIKQLPHDYDEKGVDAAYDALVEAGETVVPCLIDKITDTRVMPDPRCPVISTETKVGDVAYFVLVGLTKISFTEFFPADVQEKYKVEGVYAYHEYIEGKNSRKELQSKLHQWYQKKQRAKS